MISTAMAEAINTQINAEIYSAYLYLSMSAYANRAGLSGAASWLYVQSKEEMTHVEQFFQYLNRVGARVSLNAVAEPPSEFSSLQHIFEEVLKHEQSVTKMVNDLMTMARAEGDHATEIMLQWFVSEQIEEEENVNDILARLRLAGSTGGGLFMVDRELATRSFAPVAPSQA